MDLLALAAYGLAIFPLTDHGKTPRKDSGGVMDATSDPVKIKAWCESYPNANWAAATGDISHAVVLDIDPRNGGTESMKWLVNKYGRLPATVVVKTGGEQPGYHYYFLPTKQRIKNRVGVAPGLDIKSDRGYVLIPPSVTNNPYTWATSILDTEIAPMPGWLLEMAVRKGDAGFQFDETGQIPTGERNNYLASMGGAMRRKGFGQAAIEDALKQECEQRCGGYAGKEGEVADIAASIARYAPSDPLLERYADADVDIDIRMEAEVSERALLGFVLGSYDTSDGVLTAEVFSSVRAYQFVDRSRQHVFQEAQALWQKGITPSISNVVTSLTDQGKLSAKDEQDLDGYIEAGARIVSHGDIIFHADRISHAYMLTEAAEVFRYGLEMAKKGRMEPKDLIGHVAGRSLTILDTGQENRMMSYRDANTELRDFVKDAKIGNLGMNEPTGIADLDKKIIGYPNGELVIFAGRPSMGKTAVVLQSVTEMARGWHEREEEKCALVFSAEMTRRQLTLRNAGREARIDTTRVRQWDLSTSEEAQLYEAIDRLDYLDVYLDDTPAPTAKYMMAKALAINARKKVGVIVFDFLELIGEEKGEGAKSNFNKTLQLEAALIALKTVAKTLNCPVIVLMQLSRDVEKRATASQPPIPRLSDLRWVGQAEQLANQVMMVYYPWFFFNGGIPYAEEPDPNHYEIHVVKNRDGKVGAVPLAFLKQYGLFVPYHEHFGTDVGEIPFDTTTTNHTWGRDDD